MNYGFTMAIHMAIGFLFLGSGKYTFSTSNLSIASLLIALYPRFPDSPQDNRYHLQALRHFYVLAIENRLLQSVDIETGELVSVPLEIEYTKSSGRFNPLDQTEIRLVNTPIMLEDMHKITKIHLRDKKYNEVIIERHNYLCSDEKGTHSVFTKVSSLVEKPEFTNKSVSKTSMLGPFDVNSEHSNQIGWIPKIIYVKK